jgi:hypothetical protein
MFDYLRDFLSSVQRWLEKATNRPVIKGNLPPFTLTGDYNDAVFPMPLTSKVPWWVATKNLNDFDHSTPEMHLRYPLLTIGSWCNYDEAHRYFQKFIDKDILFRQYKQRQRSEKHYPHFKTNIKKGIIAWDITQNREVLKEYQKRQNGEKSRKSDTFSNGWERIMDRSVKLISDIKEGKIDIKSDEVQGKIGKELKKTEEIRKRNELDDPNNQKWRQKRIFSWRREFIQMKITNTIKWQEFCAAQANKN